MSGVGGVHNGQTFRALSDAFDVRTALRVTYEQPMSGR